VILGQRPNISKEIWGSHSPPLVAVFGPSLRYNVSVMLIRGASHTPVQKVLVLCLPPQTTGKAAQTHRIIISFHSLFGVCPFLWQEKEQLALMHSVTTKQRDKTCLPISTAASEFSSTGPLSCTETRCIHPCEYPRRLRRVSFFFIMKKLVENKELLFSKVLPTQLVLALGPASRTD
jgi:hypothetical protein